MADLQATFEFFVELYKFYNVDLFQRGLYQVRCSLRVSPRLPVQIETCIPDSNEQCVNGSSSCVIGGAGASRIFQILYRNEEVSLNDVIIFRVHLLVDSRHLRDCIERAEFSLHLELWFDEQTATSSLSLASSRTLHLNFNPSHGLHYHLPVLFDYFHLAAITLSIHAGLIGLHQPFIETPKIKPWIGSAKLSCRGNSSPNRVESNLFGPIIKGSLKCSSNGKASRILHAKEVYKEICALLLSSLKSMKVTIEEFNLLLPRPYISPYTLQRKLNGSTDDILEKFSGLSTVNDIDDEFSLRADADVAQLCTECAIYWRDLVAVASEPVIHSFLAKRHHKLRVRRFAEGFFVKKNTRLSMNMCYDSGFQSYTTIAEMARKSKYITLIPPLPVHCNALDGDPNSIPIIFEDRFEDNYGCPNLHDDMKLHEYGCNSNKYGASNDFKGIYSCGISDPNYRRNGFTNFLTPRFALGGDILQATLTITPSVHKCFRAASQRSMDMLLNPEEYEFSEEILPANLKCDGISARHSKSLDQLEVQYENEEYLLSRVLSEPKRRYKNENRPNRDYEFSDVSKTEKSGVISMTSLRSKNEFNEKSLCTLNENNVSKLNRLTNNNDLVDIYLSLGRESRDVLKKDYLHAMKSGVPSEASQSENYYYNSLPKVHDFRELIRKPKYMHTKHDTNSSESKLEPVKCRSNHNSLKKPKRRSSSIQKLLDADVSSTDEEDNVRALTRPKRNSKKINSSKSVPFDLALMEKTNAAGHSESLPNLLAPPPIEFDNSPTQQTLNQNKSKTSLSDESGCVSGSDTSSQSENGINIYQNNMVNGRQLRKKLLKLLDNEEVYKDNKSDAISMKMNGEYRKKTSTVTVQYKLQMEGKTPIPETKIKSTLITNGTKSNGKSKSNFDLTNVCLEDLAPPQQFCDTLLPPDEFRDPPKTRKHSNYETTKPESSNNVKKIEIKSNSVSLDGSSANRKILIDEPTKRIANGIHKSQSSNEFVYSKNQNYRGNDIEHYLSTDQIQLNGFANGSPKLDEKNDSISKKKEIEVIQFSEFEKWRENFIKLINYNGDVYSTYTKLTSELPYFHLSDEYRIFSPVGLHLIICVHGLDGNSADLRLVKTYLELGLPGAHLDFLMSERNQGDTFSDFDSMTDRLVNEILLYIDTYQLSPTRISFVAHSLGTIIVRSALSRPMMRPLLPRLYTFLSLSGPHLGTLYNSSGLVNMGMWFMQKWKKSGSLLQLCLRDTPDMRQSFLYRLSQRSNLHYFKHILLCGSSQDRYVPPHSARLELCKAAIRDTTSTGIVYREMIQNIMTPILSKSNLTLARFDIHHALPHTANTLIGRAAHIAVLDSELFIEKFLLVTGLRYFS